MSYYCNVFIYAFMLVLLFTWGYLHKCIGYGIRKIKLITTLCIILFACWFKWYLLFCRLNTPCKCSYGINKNIYIITEHNYAYKDWSKIKMFETMNDDVGAFWFSWHNKLRYLIWQNIPCSSGTDDISSSRKGRM